MRRYSRSAASWHSPWLGAAKWWRWRDGALRRCRIELCQQPSQFLDARPDADTLGVDRLAHQPSQIGIVVVGRNARPVGIEVSDTGSGIPEEERDTVLRRFHRVDRSRTVPACDVGLSFVVAVAQRQPFHLRYG